MSILESFGIDVKILLWQVINFGVLFVVLSIFLYRPLDRILRQRKNKVVGSLAQAKQSEQKARQTEQRLKQAVEAERTKMEQAQQEALRQQAKVLAQERAEAEQRVKKLLQEAEAEAKAERQRLLAEVKHEVEATSVKLAGAILQRELSPADERRMLSEAIRQLKNNVE